MKRKRFLRVEIIMLIIFLLIPSSIATGQEYIPERVLIIYDAEKGETLAKWLKNMMGTYNAIGHIISDESYEQDKINTYAKIIVISIEDLVNNSIIVEDIKQSNKDIFWIGNGIENIFSLEQKELLKFEKQDFLVKKISYDNTHVSCSWNTNLFNNKKIYSLFSNVNMDRVVSYLSDGTEEFPNLWVKDNLTNLVIEPHDTKTYYLLGDYLNDFFGITNIDTPKIYIKLEDVDIFRDINQLRDIADYLYSENVPFIISLIPVYIDEDSGYINNLSQMSGFVDTIKYMQSKGGSVVINGCRAFSSNKNTRGLLTAVRESSFNSNEELGSYIYNNIGKVLEECVLNGIFPVGFEPEQIGVESSIEKEMKKYFSTYIGSSIVGNDTDLNINYPYKLINNDNFSVFIPENLGTINPNDREWLSKINDNLKTISLVRGYLGGISFNSYLDIDYLKETVQFLKRNNSNFFDLRSINNWVKWRDISIISTNGEINVNYNKQRDEYENSNTHSTDMSIFGVDIIVFIVICIFILMFIIVFTYYKMRKKNK